MSGGGGGGGGILVHLGKACTLCLSEVEKLDLQLRIVSGRLVLGFF